MCTSKLDTRMQRVIRMLGRNCTDLWKTTSEIDLRKGDRRHQQVEEQIRRGAVGDDSRQ